MSTEWIQIVIACAVIVPLIVITGRYLHWRRWDRERRQLRMARRFGLTEYYTGLDRLKPSVFYDQENPGFSVRV